MIQVAQLYLTFQMLYFTLKGLGDIEKTDSGKLKCFSAKKLTSPTTIDNSLPP